MFRGSVEPLDIARYATIKVLASALQRRFIAVSNKLFNWYLNSYLLNISDSHIAKYNYDLKTLDLLGISLRDENAQLFNL